MTVDEIAAEIGVDSLAFITVDGMYKAIGDMARNEDQPQFCDACFTGDYPIRLASGLSAKRVSHGVRNNGRWFCRSVGQTCPCDRCHTRDRTGGCDSGRGGRR